MLPCSPGSRRTGGRSARRCRRSGGRPCHSPRRSPLAQQLGVDGIGLDVEDLQAAQALVAGLAAVEEGDAAVGGADHQAVGHLNLGGVGGGVLLGIAGLQPVDHLGLGGVGHVHHVPAGAAEGAAVHVIAPVVGLVEGHLEGVDAVQIAEAHDLHVLDIALVLRALGKRNDITYLLGNGSRHTRPVRPDRCLVRGGPASWGASGTERW